MKEYRAKLATIIKGKPTAEGSLVKLSDDDAKVYKSAGLIEEVKVDAKDKKADEKASAEAKKIDTSGDKRVEKS